MSKRTISKTIDSKFYQKKIEKKVGFSLDEILEKVANFVPNSCAPYLDKNSFRLSENWRSISIQLKNDYYLTLKGTEVDVKDIGTVFDKVLNQYYMVGEGTNSDHFYYKEAKLPMLVTASEALTEYTVSMNIFLDYYNKFKIVPALPIPVAFFECKIDHRSSHLNKFKTKLNSLYSINIDSSDLGGLGYIYKGHPARVKHWKQFCENSKLSRVQWLKSQKSFFNSEQLIQQYIKLFAELAALDWILTPIGQDHLGYAIKTQNMTLVGGFVDLGNSYKVLKELSRRDLMSFLKSIQVLCESLATISFPENRISNNFTNIMLSSHVINCLKNEFDKIHSKSLLSSAFNDFFCCGIQAFSESMNEILSDNLESRFKIII